MATINIAGAPHASEGRSAYRWLVLALLLAIYIVNYADRYLVSGLVEPIRREFGVGDAFMGLLMGPAFAILYSVMGIPLARLADRTSRIRIVCAGCLAWSLFTALTGMATSPTMLALARVGVGIGEAAFIAPTYSLIADYFPVAKRGRAFAILNVAIYVGQIVGYAGGPAIAVTHGWRGAFIALAIPGVVLSVLALLLIREPARRVAAPAIRQKLLPIVREVTRSRAYIAMIIGFGLGSLSGLSFGLWGPALFERAYDLTPQRASGTFGLYFGLAGLSGMLIFGVVSDRLARRHTRLPLLLSAAALCAASVVILLVTWSDSFLAARLLAIPAGLLGGGWSIGVLASLQYLLPDRFRATGSALFIMMTTMAGFVIGPSLTGAISQWAGTGVGALRLGLSITIPLGLIGALAVWKAAAYLEKDRAMLADPAA